ncbi:hypothetical protein ABIB85_000831 [Bradyrhizobium sp. JR1.5]
MDKFIANFVRRILSFDQQPLSTCKATINQHGSALTLASGDDDELPARVSAD